MTTIPYPNLTNYTYVVHNPVTGLLQVFFDIFGSGFLIIPISIIGGALWLKNKDIMSVTLYFTAAFTILSGSSGAIAIWGNYQAAIPLYIIIAALGWTALVIQTIFIRR
jgi:hypothetical protein